jgi:hypothetical protein
MAVRSDSRDDHLQEQLNRMLDAGLKEDICHFPFVILNLSLKKSDRASFSSMTNLKLQMENGKCLL